MVSAEAPPRSPTAWGMCPLGLTDRKVRAQSRPVSSSNQNLRNYPWPALSALPCCCRCSSSMSRFPDAPLGTRHRDLSSRSGPHLTSPRLLPGTHSFQRLASQHRTVRVRESSSGPAGWVPSLGCLADTSGRNRRRRCRRSLRSLPVSSRPAAGSSRSRSQSLVRRSHRRGRRLADQPVSLARRSRSSYLQALTDLLDSSYGLYGR
jgi:hypothetical protein